MTELHTALQVAQLAMMLSSSAPEKPVDAIYIPGLSEGMLEHPRIFDVAVRLYEQGRAPLITFNGGDGRAYGETVPGVAWPGMDYYIAELMKFGVPRDMLIPTGPGNHTGEEMRELVLAAKERGWKRVAIVTIPYHLARAFCFLVKSMEEHGYRLDVFAFCPPTTDWYAPMGASQGKGTTTPAEAAYADAAKLVVQIQKRWAASPDQVLEYIRTRAPR